MSGRRVIVVGGGVAGIAAALDCAQAGAQVTLIEVRPRLGGAAYSFEREGMLLDNGQHVFLRCCTAYRELLQRLGSGQRVSLQPRLAIPVLSPGRRPAMLRRTLLPRPLRGLGAGGSPPAPLHLARALLSYRHLTPRERVGAGLAARALGRLDLKDALERERAAGTTLGQWLAEHGQSERAIHALWDLVALPTLNVPAREASLALGAFVLQTALLREPDAGDIGFHERPLGEIVGGPALRALGRAGVDVRLGWRARAVVPSSGEEPGRLEVHGDGWRKSAEAVVVAVPHARAAGILDEALGERARGFQEIGSSPIVNVHAVYDRPVCDVGFAAGVGTPVQYLFDRSEAVGLPRGHYVAVSISGAEDEMHSSGEELQERYLRALAELLPKARDAQVQLCVASREHAATFAATPGVQELRPGPRTAVPGLALAGAWTDTGWPATLEGAARSGHSAAACALADLGLPSEPVRYEDRLAQAALV